ncbi:MAG: 2-amino-4-hydroxy-6-hydroxymethyldihydropteridine diphosphokinase [Bacteroidetes bacterium]|nr:MAG: 2-amino-4-hydroxy-6-hydroxymethyldihydropteridine diphosphokinase [Bacteroidota bacterium]
MEKRTQVHLLLGSNIGDRIANLARARTLIAERVGPLTAHSALYETEPWGVREQPLFLNQAVAAMTLLPPVELLRTLKAIEEEMGRMKTERWQARLIDIDILLYGNMVCAENGLQIPHPGLTERNFALIPLMEIAGERVHPILGKTIEELYLACRDPLEVWLFEEE